MCDDGLLLLVILTKLILEYKLKYDEQSSYQFRRSVTLLLCQRFAYRPCILNPCSPKRPTTIRQLLNSFHVDHRQVVC